MLIFVFWFSGIFPSKRGVRGVTPSYEVRGVTPTDAIRSSSSTVSGTSLQMCMKECLGEKFDINFFYVFKTFNDV